MFIFIFTIQFTCPFRLMCFFSFRVKPAAFDLFLGGCIAAYLGIVHCAIQVCSCNLWYRPDKACFCTTSLQTALHLACSLLKCWLMCHFFPLPCLFPLPELWLSLHKAQSGSEVQTPVTEDRTPCSTDCKAWMWSNESLRILIFLITFKIKSVIT